MEIYKILNSLNILEFQDVCDSGQKQKYFQGILGFFLKWTNAKDILLHKEKGICIADSEDLLLSAKEGIPWIRTICFQQLVFAFVVFVFVFMLHGGIHFVEKVILNTWVHVWTTLQF